MRAVDSSYDLLTWAEARCLKENGWPLFVQCLLALPRTGPEQPRYRIASLRNAQQEHLSIAAYIVIGSTLPGAKYVDLARAGVPNDLWDALKFVAVDVEVPGIQAEEIWGALTRLQELGKDWAISHEDVSEAGIYTSYNIWLNYVSPSNPMGFSGAGVWLWNGYWDGDPDVDFASLPFGGWTSEQVALEQWSGGTHICGQFVDRNTIVHPELIGLGGGDHMPTPEYNELKQRLDDLLAGGAAAAAQLDERLKGVEDGTLEVPIWPVGEVALTVVRHRGYHSPNQIEKLTAAVVEARGALETHIKMHNQSGGAIDRDAGAFLGRMADILDELEQEVRNLASTQ
jgi:hypothetical protein